MMKKRYLKKLCFFMAMILMILTGCQSSSDEEASKEKAESVANEEMANIENTTLNKYSDVMFDPSLTEGKLAWYFFNSVNAWTTWQSSTHAGDGMLFITPDGKTLLCDTNTANNTAYIVYALKQLGVTKIDYFLNSHPHVDHIGGFAIIAENFEIGHVYTVATEAEFSGAKGRWYNTQVGTIVEEKGIPHSYLVEGDTFMLGEDVEVKVFNPPADFDYAAGIDSYNESSIVMKLTYGESSFLTGGDIDDDPDNFGRATESDLVARYGSELQADVSKMNHHGDPVLSSMSDDWLETVNSKIYVGQMSSVPDDITFFRHVKTGAEVFHNGIDGTVLVYTSGDGTYDVQVEKDRTNNYYGTLETEDGHMRVE